jgi:hypothetical protein
MRRFGGQKGEKVPPSGGRSEPFHELNHDVICGAKSKQNSPARFN